MSSTDTKPDVVTKHASRPPERNILRVLACGAVDDGKSTLLGRLMMDAGVVPEDQIAAIAQSSRDVFDYALLFDGLEAEREQSVTIDVAYRYFSTLKRSFILADSPGHEQFTRNMATAASVSDVAVLLIDARKGVLQQTRRHATIVAMMGIRDVLLAVNKLDLVGDTRDVFNDVVAAFSVHAEQLGLRTVAIPVSAWRGDNVVHQASAMSWYEGRTLLEHLESIDISGMRPDKFRFPIQRVSRPDSEFRGYQGSIAGGRIRRGDPIVALPSGQPSRIARIVTFEGDLEEAESGRAVTLTLTDEIEAGRGTIFAHPDVPPVCASQIVARLVWFSDEKSSVERPLLMRHMTGFVPCRIAAVRSRFDVVNLVDDPAATLGANDIGIVTITTETPAVVDRYKENRSLGAFLLVDRQTNKTLAAGMVVEAVDRSANVYWQKFDMRHADRLIAQKQAAAILWLTGPSGAGKSTAANAVETMLTQAGYHAYVLDGDNVRHGLNRDLGFSATERSENVRRLAEVARLLGDAGLITVVAAIAPYARDRANARSIAGDIPFYEIFVDTPLEVCAQRDPKGLYARARSGQLNDFTGVGAPYERPVSPNLTLEGGSETPAEEARRILALLAEHGHLRAFDAAGSKGEGG